MPKLLVDRQRLKKLVPWGHRFRRQKSATDSRQCDTTTMRKIGAFIYGFLFSTFVTFYALLLLRDFHFSNFFLLSIIFSVLSCRPEHLLFNMYALHTPTLLSLFSQVTALMDCTPHYVRCVKSNDAKAPKTIDKKRASHQCQYLGLPENIRGLSSFF